MDFGKVEAISDMVIASINKAYILIAAAIAAAIFPLYS